MTAIIACVRDHYLKFGEGIKSKRSLLVGHVFPNLHRDERSY